MKHLQQTYETPEILEKIRLQTCMYMQHPDLLLQHPDENTCNIRLIQMKHLEHTLETYVYKYCNMCNIPIYFYNISIYFCNTDTKHLQHTSEIPETYVCNMHFQCNISLLLGNGGSLVCGVHRCRAHQLRGARCSGGEGRDRFGGEGRAGSLRWRRKTTHWRSKAAVCSRRHGEGGRRAAALGRCGDVGR